MNKKLIAVAVSSALAVPVIAQAEGEVKVYGRINQSITLKDVSGDDSNVDVTTVSSRFGIRYDNDLGNGLSVHGRYEFDVRSDRELPGINDVRIGTVGVSGAFGRFDIGNQWSAYFNTFGTFVSPTYSLGFYIYSSVGGGPFRASNTLKYSNTFGPVYFELDARLNGSDEAGDVAEKLAGDGIGVGITFDAGDYVSIGAAIDYEDGPDSDDDPVAVRDDNDTRYGLAVKVKLGELPVSVTGGWQNHDAEKAGTAAVEADDVDVDAWFLWFAGSFTENTKWLLGYSNADGDGGEDADQFTWGVYHTIGGGLRVYYEAISLDRDNGADVDHHLLGLRVDF